MTSPQSMEAARECSKETDNCHNGEETGGVDETDTCPNLPEEEKNIEKPLPVDGNFIVENVALSNRQRVAKFLQEKIKDFCPLKYIKNNIEYCIRVRVNFCKIIDLHCRYTAGAHKILSMKRMEHEDDKMTFEFKR